MTEIPPPGEQPDPTREAPILPPPPPSYQPAPATPYGVGPAEKTDAAGFLRALFDFSFSTFITPKVVRFVYILATGLLVLLVGPIVMLVYLALIRMTLEFYLAITRMSQDIHHRLPPRA